MQHLSRDWNSTAKKEEMMDYGIRRSELEHLIDEYCFNEKYRYILKRRFLDGICFEPLSEEIGMSVRQVKNIVYKEGDKVLKHIERP